MERIRAMKTKVLSGTLALIVTIALLGVFFGSAAVASGTEVSLSAPAGSGAPGASGQAEIEFAGTVMQGSVSVDGLPPQAFGTGRFYGAWFVRTDTGDKAFLGALIGNDSIILSAGGEGATNFAATHFTNGPITTGPNPHAPITLGPAGKNLIIVLIEDKINGLDPSPVGVAVSGTF